MSARLRELCEKRVERWNLRIRELLVEAHETGRDEDNRNICGGERAAKVGVGKERLLEHVVVSDDDGLHALRLRRNPEIRSRGLLRLLVDETIDFHAPLVYAPDGIRTAAEREVVAVVRGPFAAPRNLGKTVAVPCYRKPHVASVYRVRRLPDVEARDVASCLFVVEDVCGLSAPCLVRAEHVRTIDARAGVAHPFPRTRKRLRAVDARGVGFPSRAA